MSEPLTENMLHAVSDERELLERFTLADIDRLTAEILPDINTLYRESFEQARIVFDYLTKGSSERVEQSPNYVAPMPTGIPYSDGKILDERLMKQYTRLRETAMIASGNFATKEQS